MPSSARPAIRMVGLERVGAETCQDLRFQKEHHGVRLTPLNRSAYSRLGILPKDHYSSPEFPRTLLDWLIREGQAAKPTTSDR